MMDSELVLSKLRGDGWDDEYSSLSEFKKDLDEAEATWAQQKLQEGWVLYDDRQHQHYQIITLLRYIEPEYWVPDHYMVQFWAVVKVEGKKHYLETSHQPFFFHTLHKGIIWFRKLCKGHVYVVDVEAADDELPGRVGRAYRNKQPETTPDLRLYSANQFPMRDDAALCGFTGYMAIPLYDSRRSEYYGVMEILSRDCPTAEILHSISNQGLEIAGFKSTRDSISIGGFKKEKKPESEITDILKLAMETVPRLYLAQVWVPCKQFANTNTNLCSMELASYVESESPKFCSWDLIDDDVSNYVSACELHNILIDVSSFGSKLCDVNISKNPLAHYAQRARMSHYFQVCIQSLNISNHFYIIHFFLKPKPCREDAYGDNSLHLLLRIMEMNLKTFKLASGDQLLEGILIQSRQPNAVECGSIDSLNVMNSYKDNFSESDFTTYLETVNSCCQRPSLENRRQGWAFRFPGGQRLCVNDIEEKIEDFIKKIAFKPWDESKQIVQFWAPRKVKDRCYLQTFDQPYAVDCLAKGIASFRKVCMTHKYYVDDKAKDEELGPPGRVFRNGHPEFTPDLFHYTTREFSLRNYAMHCCSRAYFVLPIFDPEHNHKCVGVLEFLGFFWSDLEDIARKLKAAKLCSIHTDLYPRFLAYEQTFSTIYCRREALTEVNNALKLIYANTPQLYMANVWVPNGECVTSSNSNTSCMEIALSTGYLGKFMPTNKVRWIHIQTRKGMIGMLLASENKSCFCRNLCEFSIADQPLSHFDMIDRLDVSFAICLQSSHTGDLIYVLEFFLYEGPATYDYLRSFLNFLLPIMKQELKSFKMASGKELGEELVVEVIEFSDANKLDSSGSDHQTDVFPIKFISVQYNSQDELQYIEEQTGECSIVVEHQHTEEQTEESSVNVELQHTEEQQIEECTAAASYSKKRKRKKSKTVECGVAASDSKTGAKGKTKPRHDLHLEDLEQLFHVEKLKDVRTMLNVCKATLFRARVKYGLFPWPGKHKKNQLPRDSQQDLQPSTSNIQPLDTTNTGSTHHVIVEEVEAEKAMMIKLKYEKILEGLSFFMSLGLAKLIEEVARTLQLEIGTFQLTYLDEDEDEIILANDSDLQLCQKSQITVMHRTFIQVRVRIMQKVTEVNGDCSIENQDADDVEEFLRDIYI